MSLVTQDGRRLHELDGIRGWAALSVACFHIFWETFGVLIPGLRNPVTAAVFAGHFDVIVFFILSGEALSHPFFCSGGIDYLKRATLRRYLRLTIPIAVVASVTMIIMVFRLDQNFAAGQLVGRPDWLGSFAHFSPGGNKLLKYAFYFVYVGNYEANYLPFLWTMPIELLDSLLLMLVLTLFPSIRRAEWVVAGLAMVLVKSDAYLGCFLIGALLSRARMRGLYERVPRGFARLASPLVIGLALAVVARYQLVSDQSLLPHAVAGTALLVGIYTNRPLARFLSRDPLSQFLGRISYLLYLWHFVVLISFTSFLIVGLAARDWLVPWTAIAIGAATLALSIGLSAWTMPIETWARVANGLMLRLIYRDRSVPQ